ncbi:unnamed protein product [Arabis nemorensis]|uniref:Uncharacterized protein n=1 Tax=Arabis nemorensis TaxID=586526 RepID=A0A565AWK0_9BRAS|nr:unnamed protein product [Arabis nemorensis]
MEILIIEKYERRSGGLLKKLEEYPSVKKETKKVPGLEKKVMTQITLMDDLSKKAEEERQRAEFAEEELERVKTEKESLQSFHNQETALLRSSRRHEVVQIIASSDVSDDRFKELDENFERFEKDFDALDVEEDTEGDFKMTPPPWMSLNPPQCETAAASVNPPQPEIVASFDQNGTLMSVEDQKRDRLLLVDDLGVEAQA